MTYDEFPNLTIVPLDKTLKFALRVLTVGVKMTSCRTSFSNIKDHMIHPTLLFLLEKGAWPSHLVTATELNAKIYKLNINIQGLGHMASIHMALFGYGGNDGCWDTRYERIIIDGNQMP